MDEKFSIIIDINENYESYKKHAKSNKDEFKNKFVLFYTTWNDAGFYTLLVVRNFYENFNGKIIGTIRICHDNLVIDNENKELLEIRHFLEEDYNSKGKISITDKLGEEYISIADSCLYDKLKEILIDDKVVIEFLSRFNEISTITDNKRIEERKSKEWYEKSFIRYDEEIVAFTECKNILGIKDNSYVVKKNLSENSDKINLSEYFDKIKTNIAGLYKWALNYDLSIEESKQVFYFIKVNHIESSEGVEDRNNVLKKFKDSYAEYIGFIKEIDKILIKNNKFHDLIEEIKNILKVERGELDNIEIGHYTSLETIKQLIKKKNRNNENENEKAEGTYLRLTNGRQMNDPLEGKLLLDYILNKNTNSEDWEATLWYISSTTTETDSLPMWKQYGGDTKGGMLVYDKDYLNKIIDIEGVAIYRVCYVDVVNDKIKVIPTKKLIDCEKEVEQLEDKVKDLEDEIKKEEDKIKDLEYEIKKEKEKYKKLNNIIKELEKIDEDEIHPESLSNIGFLFKKSDYSYENEYRIVVDVEKMLQEEIAVEDNPNSKFPFLYVYLTEEQLKYSKVILGPKAIDIDYVAPYIHYCDKKIKIERSSISYR